MRAPRRAICEHEGVLVDATAWRPFNDHANEGVVILATNFLTALVRGGANLEAVRELAGHSKLLTTQRYLHASGADLRDAVSRLPGNAKPLGN